MDEEDSEQQIRIEEVPQKPPLPFFRRFAFALVGGSSYRQLGDEVRGWYTYFLVVAGITALALSIVVTVTEAHSLSALMRAWKLLPDFSIQNSTLSVPSGVKLPLTVKVPGAVVELSDSASPQIESTGTPAWLAIGNSGLTLLLGSGLERSLPYSSLGISTLNKQTIGTTLALLYNVGLWVEGIVSVLYQLGTDFLRAAIIAWIAMTMTRLMGRGPSWPQAWRIGMAAWTLPLLAEILTAFIAIPDWSLWIVAGCYAVIGCSQFGPGDAALIGRP